MTRDEQAIAPGDVGKVGDALQAKPKPKRPTYDEAVAACKARALTILNGGDGRGAVAAMAADLGAADLFHPSALATMVAQGEGLDSDDERRRWIEGF